MRSVMAECRQSAGPAKAGQRAEGPPHSVMLGVMRWRGSFVCALAGSLGLALLLVLACHGGLTASAASGMSAPVVPAPSTASAPVAHFLQSQFDWHGCELRALGFSVVLARLGAIEKSNRRVNAAAPHYGPLHRRPPPSFF